MPNLYTILQHRVWSHCPLSEGAMEFTATRMFWNAGKEAKTVCPLHIFRKIEVRRTGVLLIKGFEKHHTSVNIPEELRKQFGQWLTSDPQFWLVRSRQWYRHNASLGGGSWASHSTLFEQAQYSGSGTLCCIVNPRNV